VQIWQLDLLQPQELIEAGATAVLAPAEAERRPAQPARAWRRRAVARLGLRIALGRHLGLPPASLRFERGPAGKPALGGSPPPCWFSTSRSGELCLIAISDRGPVGGDVEEIHDSPRLWRLAERRFLPSETTAILDQQGARRLLAFYRCWTRKEAFLKAIGTGLAAGLDSVEVTIGPEAAILGPGDLADRWSLEEVPIRDGFAAALAWDGTAGEGGPSQPRALELELAR
jgi:4'-phosphopantetheinyl transferase